MIRRAQVFRNYISSAVPGPSRAASCPKSLCQQIFGIRFTTHPLRERERERDAQFKLTKQIHDYCACCLNYSFPLEVERKVPAQSLHTICLRARSLRKFFLYLLFVFIVLSNRTAKPTQIYRTIKHHIIESPHSAQRYISLFYCRKRTPFAFLHTITRTIGSIL